MINELYIGYSEPDDGFELWNRAPDQDMTAWSVKWNDSEQGSGIAYQIPDRYHGKQVSIQLYTLRGELVKTLVNGAMGSGYYLISLSKYKELASGNYICRMKADNYTEAIHVVNQK